MLDPHSFWEENQSCLGKPFRTDKPRAPLTLGFDEHWLFEEMEVESTLRYYREPAYQLAVNKACNDRCDPTIGLRPYSESPPKPGPKRIELLFGAREELTEGSTPWLEPGHTAPESLSATLDELLPLTTEGIMNLAFKGVDKPREDRGRDDHATYTAWSRGPTTVGCSILGPERYLEWLFDEPELMHCYFDTFAQVMVRYHQGLAAGATITGTAWLDDFCCLMSPSLYEEFALPAMKQVMNTMDGYRFQHSDSDMGHLLPLLAELHFDGVNFGPKLTVREIRDAMPKTEIHGQIAPFLLRNGSMADVERKVREDFEEIGRDGGLVVTTAGSVAAGTTLERIRSLMEIVDRDCRY